MDIQSIFNAALDINDAAARAEYLQKACAHDPEMHERVEALLAAHFRDEQFLEQPAIPAPTLPAPTIDYLQPITLNTIIGGKYKIREKIGEGGMGDVFVVETITEVKAYFALKLIKPGSDSRSVLARFEQERQALALMNHPNIAKFIDAGMTDSGQPFFVMELIKGLPITRFCDHEKLTVEERLKLFRPICQAVQHAHQKGIIHRDLKPSNILVAIYDGVPIPKIIDFGVAKATHRPLTDLSIYSEIGAMIGTLEYMAPEQAEVNSLDIDTRADLYSLGVILYELMTGTVPFSRKELSAAAMLQMLEMIREEEPHKPSTRISGSGSLPSVAATRKIEPRALTRKLQGELDWIVMKCLEKERNRRYDGPNQLAQDLENYLADLPVLAGPPSATYRLKKFMKRNQGKVLAAALLLLALVGGSIGTAWGWYNARQAEQHAETEAATAQAINLFLETGILKQADPAMQAESGILIEPDIKLREAVNRAGKLLLDNQLNEQPAVKAALHHTIGKTLLALGDFQQARIHLDQMTTLRRATLGEQHTVFLTSQLDVAQAQFALQQYAEAERLAAASIDKLSRHYPAHHPEVLRATRLRASCLQYLNKIEENRVLWQQIVATCDKEYGTSHLETSKSQAGLAAATGLVGIKHNDRTAQLEADRLFEQSLASLQRLLGIRHPDYLDVLNSHAYISSRRGELTQAETIYRRLIDLYGAIVDADHNSLLIARQNLATVYFKQKRFDDAKAVLQDVYQKYLKRYGPDYDGALAARTGLAGLLFTQGEYRGAEEIYRDALQLIERKKGPRDHDANRFANQLAETLYRQNQLAEAEKYFLRVLETNLQVKPVSEVNLYENRVSVIKARHKQHKHQDCLELFTQIFSSIQQSKQPAFRQAVLHAMHAESLLATKQPDQARVAAQRSNALFEKDKAEFPQEYAPGKDRAQALENLEATRRKL